MPHANLVMGSAAWPLSSAPSSLIMASSAWPFALGVDITLDWTVSDSADIAGYQIRKGLNGYIDRADDVYATDVTPPWTDSIEGDAHVIYGLQAYDASGNVEGNIEEMVQFLVQDGVVTSFPVAPRRVIVTPIAGTKLRVSWIYSPWQEVNDPGAAYEARIYYDNATGTIDYTAPHATVALSNPTAEASYSWDSAGLVNGQEYRFVVRIATAADPSGFETQNTDEHAGTADSGTATAVTLAATVV